MKSMHLERPVIGHDNFKNSILNNRSIRISRIIGIYTDSGKEANYTIYDVSGWGPDYGDPATYLDTFLPDYAGYMIKCIGIY